MSQSVVYPPRPLEGRMAFLDHVGSNPVTPFPLYPPATRKSTLGDAWWISLKSSRLVCFNIVFGIDFRTSFFPHFGVFVRILAPPGALAPPTVLGPEAAAGRRAWGHILHPHVRLGQDAVQ